MTAEQKVIRAKVRPGNDGKVREGVHVALADCEQIFRAQEVNDPLHCPERLSRRPRRAPPSAHRS